MDTKYFSKDSLQEVVNVLKRGGVIAFPTETVYGLGAHIEQKQAIEKIYLLKNREKNKSMIVHIDSLNIIERIATDIPSGRRNGPSPVFRLPSSGCRPAD